jgi:hypothetical protein
MMSAPLELSHASIVAFSNSWAHFGIEVRVHAMWLFAFVWAG